MTTVLKEKATSQFRPFNWDLSCCNPMKEPGDAFRCCNDWHHAAPSFVILEMLLSWWHSVLVPMLPLVCVTFNSHVGGMAMAFLYEWNWEVMCYIDCWKTGRCGKEFRLVTAQDWLHRIWMICVISHLKAAPPGRASGCFPPHKYFKCLTIFSNPGFMWIKMSPGDFHVSQWSKE